jgi:hypothetical protein
LCRATHFIGIKAKQCKVADQPNVVKPALKALHRVKICLFLNPDTQQVSWEKNLNNRKHLKKPNVGIPFFKMLASNFCAL